MSSRLGPYLLCAVLTYSRVSVSVGMRCSTQADHCTISSSLRLNFALAVILRQNFPVTLAGGELFFQGGGIDADEIQEPLIQRTMVDVFPIFPDDGRAALVQHAR